VPQSAKNVVNNSQITIGATNAKLKNFRKTLPVGQVKTSILMELFKIHNLMQQSIINTSNGLIMIDLNKIYMIFQMELQLG
jgi:hypothetical protein